MAWGGPPAVDRHTHPGLPERVRAHRSRHGSHEGELAAGFTLRDGIGRASLDLAPVLTKECGPLV